MLLNILLFLHQLPQNIIGCIVYLIVNPKRYRCSLDGQWQTYYVAQRFKGSWGVSLGSFVFFGSERELAGIRHEHGHQIQSLYLGWLYLLVVGIPSFVRCIFDILFHKNWTTEERIKWYYSGFPEKWADKLGGVQR